MGYSTSGEFTNAERTKLTGIEALADVTDDANVGATSAVMDADFSGASGFMEKASAGVYDLITSQELNADIIDLIRPLHPNVSMLAAIDDGTLSSMYKSGDDYKLGAVGGDLIIYSDGTVYSISCTGDYCTDIKLISTHTITEDRTDVYVYIDLKTLLVGGNMSKGYYTINDGGQVEIGSVIYDDSYTTKNKYIGSLSNGDVVKFYLKVIGGNAGSVTAYGKNCILKANSKITGDVLTDAIAANAAVLSFFSHLKGKFSNGASSHALPIGVEIFGNGDSYAAALNATTKFKIDVADPRIELYRTDDSEVAKSNDQTDWVLDDNVTNGAFPTKTTSTHETILAEEIGCASIVLVEKSVNGAFTDTEILIEDDDYTVDYSTRTATKIIITSAEAADIVISQSKLRITWIADVEDIEGTANTALKMKIYLNRTANTEASPEIQKIDLGTDKYAEMQYLCG